MCWMIKQMFFLRPAQHPSLPFPFLFWLFVTHLEKLMFSFPIKHLPALEVRVDLLSSAPLKSFTHLPFGQTHLELWNALVSAFCFGEKHVLFLHEGYSVTLRSQTPHFFCIAQGVIHHFHSLFGSPTRVFKLARRKTMKSLPGREVFCWDVGRGEEKRGGEGICGEVCTYLFFWPLVPEFTWMLM